ncbi:metalloregulator ArsR/SmtB family transcription factor [Treponema sp.]|uniref:ArsR/SmtB family transcription factor n=1 Tax=Treponema sp. TaxID=166 RepID=UPI00298E78C1|nr:metalloregulator ArsR/SmtB family transcription factor [Treponema sp.]
MVDKISQSALTKQVKDKIPDDETITDLAELFKVFGDATRAKIISCLEVKDLYVGELAEILGMSISAVSHQLRVLRSAKLVKGTKEGKEVKYSLDDNHVAMIMECGLTHIHEAD